ncbi:hypothetical protein V5G24_00055 [Xanthobacter sp. VTT E-85241]|uniref:hypothetical protein n=1 Tax=Roseixanthobacter finlandensis TaxID=3119922 RepID=UPI00372CA34C
MNSYSARELLFHAVRNAQYHTARRRTLERWNRWATSATILLGTAVVADAAGKTSFDVVWLGLATSIIGIAQLVFDFGGRARTHEILQRRYYDLIAGLRRKPEPTEAEVADWNSTITLIYGDEPPFDPVSDALAYNAAGNALGMDDADVLIVPWWLQLLGHFGMISGWRFETRGERAARQKAGTHS